jgi:hypothetical protein
MRRRRSLKVMRWIFREEREVEGGFNLFIIQEFVAEVKVWWGCVGAIGWDGLYLV